MMTMPDQQRVLCGVEEIAHALGIDEDTARKALRQGLVEGAWQGSASGTWLARSPRVEDAVIRHPPPAPTRREW